MYAFKIVTVNFANDPHIEILFPSQLPPLCLAMVKGGEGTGEGHTHQLCANGPAVDVNTGEQSQASSSEGCVQVRLQLFHG